MAREHRDSSIYYEPAEEEEVVGSLDVVFGMIEETDEEFDRRMAIAEALNRQLCPACGSNYYTMYCMCSPEGQAECANCGHIGGLHDRHGICGVCKTNLVYAGIEGACASG